MEQNTAAVVAGRDSCCHLDLEAVHKKIAPDNCYQPAAAADQGKKTVEKVVGVVHLLLLLRFHLHLH